MVDCAAGRIPTADGRTGGEPSEGKAIADFATFALEGADCHGCTEDSLV